MRVETNTLVVFVLMCQLASCLQRSDLNWKTAQACTRFKNAPSSSKSVLSVAIQGFSTAIESSVVIPGTYKFGCVQGELRFKAEKTSGPCSIVNAKSRNTFHGEVQLPAVDYSFPSCYYAVTPLRGAPFRSEGFVSGSTDGVEAEFRIEAAGSRRICSLEPPQMKNNFVLFPPKFFATAIRVAEGLNNRVVREKIMKVINNQLASRVAAAVAPKYECSSFFKIIT